MSRLSFLILIIFNLPQLLFAQDTVKGSIKNEEMRGLWVATTKNIDFPSGKYLTVAQQKQEFIDLLELCEDVGINAVFVQVRPAADAFFDSPYEPWSEWLTGKQGKAPDPYYDPMQFMIDECKKRDIEFHAWVNPFRAIANIETADIADDHISNRKHGWFFTYDINTYFNPGIPEVREYLVKIIEDIVMRYDVDGIHFDDYFYPYPVRDESNRLVPVPDYDTFAKYKGKFVNIEDWRRDNLNKFISAVNESIKSINPAVKFGIGPSGVWRNKSTDPKGSDTRGLAHYDYLYADVLKWLKEDWIDYVSPQIYWHIGHSHADFATLVQWWNKNTYGKHLYIGQGIYMAREDAGISDWRDSSQLPDQLTYLRKFENVKGVIFYKASALRRNPLGYNDKLKADYFAAHAAPPKMDWLPELVAVDVASVDKIEESVVLVDLMSPPAPHDISVVKLGKYYMLSWKAPRVSGKNFDDKAVKYGVYQKQGFFAADISADKPVKITDKTYVLLRRHRLSLFKKDFTFVITATDAADNESIISESVTLKLKK